MSILQKSVKLLQGVSHVLSTLGKVKPNLRDLTIATGAPPKSDHNNNM